MTLRHVVIQYRDDTPCSLYKPTETPWVLRNSTPRYCTCIYNILLDHNTTNVKCCCFAGCDILYIIGPSLLIKKELYMDTTKGKRDPPKQKSWIDDEMAHTETMRQRLKVENEAYAETLRHIPPVKLFPRGFRGRTQTRGGKVANTMLASFIENFLEGQEVVEYKK